MVTIKDSGGVRLIDPNPDGTDVNQEDLVVYVKLRALTKSRSILTETSEGVTEIETTFKNGIVDFTHPEKELSTDWTKIGGNIEMGSNGETFGITNIDIDIKSSFIPQIVIDFIDVRGATLFEQGPCSPYAAFFHMPYPVFELTVKGYYGKPVTYTLALRKFNTKFNPSTGNFEVKGEFIGYTYAFLADIVMGYAIAAPYMVGGDKILESIWLKALESRQGDLSDLNRLPDKPVTIKDFIGKVNKLEKDLGVLFGTSEFTYIRKLDDVKSEIKVLEEIIYTYKDDLIKNLGVTLNEKGILVGDTKMIKERKVRETTLSTFGENGVYFDSVDNLNKLIKENNLGVKPLPSNAVDITKNNNGFYDVFVENKVKGNLSIYFDINEALLLPINKLNIELEKKITEKQLQLTEIVNSVVKQNLDFTPTVRNIFTLIMTNVETFLTLLTNSSGVAENIHRNESNKETLYPWPTYQTSAIGSTGFVEKYPGNEKPNWEEVRFVEDFIRSYVETMEDLSVITGDIDGVPGYERYLPLNTIESPAYDGETPIGNPYLKISNIDDTLKTIGERAFLTGDHTLMNGLLVWKSMVSVDTQPISTTTPNLLLSKSEIQSRRDLSYPLLTNGGLMFNYGRMDGMNMVMGQFGNGGVVKLRTIKQLIGDRNNFKRKIEEQLNKSGKYKNQSFSEWVGDYCNGLTPTDIDNILNDSIELPGSMNDYYKNVSSDRVYSYSDNIIVGDVIVTPNPHNTPNFTIFNEENVRNGGSGISSDTLLDKQKTTIEDNENLTDNTNIYGTINKYLSSKGRTLWLFPDDKLSFNNELKQPKVVIEKTEDNFFKKPDFDTHSVTYTIGGVSYLDTIIHRTRFGNGWVDNDDQTKTTLVRTPLWGLNLDNSKYFKYFHKMDDDTISLTQTTYQGRKISEIESKKSLAYLMLITCGDSKDSDNTGLSMWVDDTTTSIVDGYVDYLKTLPSIIDLPRVNQLQLGAILWRYRESITSFDPIIWDGSVMSPTVKKFEPYHYPLTTFRFQKNNPKSKTVFTFISSQSNHEYIDMRTECKTLLLLPDGVKNQLIDTFIGFSTSEEWTEFLTGLDPVHFSSDTDINKYYDLDGDTWGVKNNGDTINTTVQDLYEYLFNMEKTENYTRYITTTPKIFYGIHKDHFNSAFILKENEFNQFLDGWVKGFNLVYETRLREISGGDNEGENTNLRSIIDDEDIKLNFYRSFKSLYDKWIARSKSGNDFKLFYNNTGNDKGNRLLIDHFSFVNRTFGDIGNKSVIDVSTMKDVIENPTMALYTYITNILSKNNFDFFPLPNFINYQKTNNDDLKLMFETVTDISNIEATPSFVCMFVGGTSRNLDMGPTVNSQCKNNQIQYEYLDDGISFTKIDGLSKDISDSTEPVTAFIVRYGSENQSHFKSLNLDQAEFKETQESLLVIDKLAKGGDGANKSSKGQNLYNLYLTRSYTCEVESFGNMMIQPMMYFHLDNVPMFHGGYLITDVKHNFSPHHSKTTFKGVRVPRVTIPLVTDAYTAMNLSNTEVEKNSKSTEEFLNSKGLNQPGKPLDTNTFVDPDIINELGFQLPIKQTELQDKNGNVIGLFDGIVVSSGVGPRKSPKPGASSNHLGVDLRTKTGTPIYAVGNGTVEKIKVEGGGYGLHIIIDHGVIKGKRYRTLYAHLSNINPNILDLTTLTQQQLDSIISSGLFKFNNTSVKKGEVIGYAGGDDKTSFVNGVDTSGTSTKSHLHFELRESEGNGGFYSKEPKTKIKNPLAVIDPTGEKTRYKGNESSHGDLPQNA